MPKFPRKPSHCNPYVDCIIARVELSFLLVRQIGNWVPAETFGREDSEIQISDIGSLEEIYPRPLKRYVSPGFMLLSRIAIFHIARVGCYRNCVSCMSEAKIAVILLCDVYAAWKSVIRR